MTLKEAFIALIYERGIYAKLGVSRKTVSGWKAILKGKKVGNQKEISDKKMRQMLEKAGRKRDQEESWTDTEKN